jgi:peroxiredoxin Q/BCP
VVLFFYPKDFTSGCTAEVCAFRDQFKAIVQHDAVVIGVSGDDETSHRKFSSAYALPYYLVSDRDGSIGKKHGAFWLGGLLPFMKRTTYIIDKEGTIRGVFRHGLRISRHVEDALACLTMNRSK